MNFLKNSLVLLFCAVVLSSCAGASRSGRFAAAPPAEQASARALKKELSTVDVAIDISSGELASLLDRTVPKGLYSGATRSAGISASVVRNGRIGVGAAGEGIDLSVPVAVSLSYGFFETPALATTLRFRITPKISPDWRLDPGLSFSGLTGNVPELLKIGPLALKPRSVLDGLVAPLERVLSAAIGNKLNEKLNLKAEVAKVWREAQRPVRLDKERNAWLVLAPKGVLLYPLAVANGHFKVALGLRCFAEVVIGPQPLAPAPVPLPPLTLGRTPQGFRVALNSELFYKELLQIARPYLIDKEFGHGGRSVIIKGIDLYGNGDLLVVRVDTAGSLEGTIYLTGKPVFDRQKNRLSVQNLDFDLQTRDLLARSADWLLHSTIRDAVQEKLNIDLAQHLAQAQQLAANPLARVKLAENIFLCGKLSAFRLTDLMVERDRISLQLYGEGESVITFH